MGSSYNDRERSESGRGGFEERGERGGRVEAIFDDYDNCGCYDNFGGNYFDGRKGGGNYGGNNNDCDCDFDNNYNNNYDDCDYGYYGGGYDNNYGCGCDCGCRRRHRCCICDIFGFGRNNGCCRRRRRCC